MCHVVMCSRPCGGVVALKRELKRKLKRELMRELKRKLK